SGAGPVARQLARFGAIWRRSGNHAEKNGGVSAREDRVELITWQQKPSMISESFRSALLSILFSKEGDRPPQVLVITSAEPSEGKSTVASNLGIAVAETGKKVLLIDG